MFAQKVPKPQTQPAESRANKARRQFVEQRDPSGESVRFAPESVARTSASPLRPPGAAHRFEKRAAAASETPDSVHAVLDQPGHALDAATRVHFEPRFGHDFSRVRVHADDLAAESAAAVGASAYTVGQHIVFHAGAYRPTSAAGRNLIAHELAHTVQQGNATLPQRLTLLDSDSAGEQNAESASRAVNAGQQPDTTSRTGIALARQMLTRTRDEDSPTFGNLEIKEETPSAGPRRVELTLNKETGKWSEFATGRSPEARTASGSYDFVIQDGRIKAVRSSGPYGHTEAALGERVTWAGTITFSNKGNLKTWDNASGHFLPSGEFAENAAKAHPDLPIGKFVRTYRGSVTRPTGERVGPQLPVIQEKKGTTLEPRGSTDKPDTASTRKTGDEAPVPRGTGDVPDTAGPKAGGVGGLATPEATTLPSVGGLGAKELIDGLKTDLRLLRAARILNTVLRVVEFAGTVLMVYQSISMVKNARAGKGFIMTDEISGAEGLRDKANALGADYPAYSDSIQGLGFSLFAAGSNSGAIKELLDQVSDLGAEISSRKVDLGKQAKRVKAGLKEATTKRQAIDEILNDPLKVAALDHGGSTINSATLFAAGQDFSRIESALMQADPALDVVISSMDADIEFLVKWIDWLQEVGEKKGLLPPPPTIVVSKDQLKELTAPPGSRDR
jgi:hypothetical protein